MKRLLSIALPAAAIGVFVSSLPPSRKSRAILAIFTTGHST